MLILQSEMYSKVLDTDHLRTQDHIDMSIHQKGQGSPSNNECMKCHHELRLADVLCITETHFHRFFQLQLEECNMVTCSRLVFYTNYTDMAKTNTGGVAVYYKITLTAEAQKYLQNMTD